MHFRGLLPHSEAHKRTAAVSHALQRPEKRTTEALHGLWLQNRTALDA